ncbi:MAG: FIST N-terminal domain-containing protein [Myxococcota bacterium]
METFQGHSDAADAQAAVDAATAGWPAGLEPKLILAFASTHQQLGPVREILRAKYPGAELVGCSTAGEHTTGHHHRGALALTAIAGPELDVACAFSPDLAAFDAARAASIAGGLFQRLGVTADEIDLEHTFCVMLIDGLSRKEEQVAALMADALEGVPMIGGSAGDDLGFARTEVMATEGCGSGAAAFILGRARVPVRFFKHQHFQATSRSLVITRADVEARRVFEMDGYPAAEAYARALGKESASEVTPELCFLNPLMFQSHGQHYVRSIQKIEPDGSIIFYCGIEEGLVLDVARHDDIVDSLKSSLSQSLAGMGRPQLVLGMNCILRALEAEQTGQHCALADALADNTDCFVGFDTYGEQLNGLHINQTIVGLAFGREERR